MTTLAIQWVDNKTVVSLYIQNYKATGSICKMYENTDNQLIISLESIPSNVFPIRNGGAGIIPSFGTGRTGVRWVALPSLQERVGVTYHQSWIFWSFLLLLEPLLPLGILDDEWLDGAILLVDGFVLGKLDGTLGVEEGISDGISLGFDEGIIDEGILDTKGIIGGKNTWSEKGKSEGTVLARLHPRHTRWLLAHRGRAWWNAALEKSVAMKRMMFFMVIFYNNSVDKQLLNPKIFWHSTDP